MALFLEDKHKKALVTLELINKETKEVNELGFATKIYMPEKGDVVLITSPSIFPDDIDAHLDEIVVHRWKPKPKQNDPVRVKRVESHKQADVNTVVFEGEKNYSLRYKVLTEKEIKQHKKLTACVFEGKRIIELQFENKGGSYKLSNVSKEDFDVKRAKGAPVIIEEFSHYMLGIPRYNHKIIGVLCMKSNGDVYPALFKDGFLEDEKPPSSDKTKAGPSHIDKTHHLQVEEFGRYENFALDYENQVPVSDLQETLNRMKHSIGAIIAINNSDVRECGATCFRIGTKYVITNKHVVDEINELGIQSWSSCYVDFNYKEQVPQPAASFLFNFAPNPVRFCSEDLDYVILELRSNGEGFPPSVTDFGFNIAPPGRQLKSGECLTLIGHPGGRRKQIDVSCPIKLLQDIQKHRRDYDARTISLMEEACNHPDHATYDVSTFFKGASGSPGISMEKTLLVVLHKGGIFQGTNCVLEYGILMSSVVIDVTKKIENAQIQNVLNDIFGGSTSSIFDQCSLRTQDPGKKSGYDEECVLKEIEDDTIPNEILARGPEALKAYEEALESGKTKNRRLLVIVLGPARAGKTSLLKSLNGEKFDPKEDSTNGIQLQRTFCKSQENCWSKESTKGISYADCMADIIHKNLKGGEDTEELHGENFAKARKESIEKSVVSNESLSKNDDDDRDEDHDADKDDEADDDNDAHGNDDDKMNAIKVESIKEELENQKYLSEKSIANLPKSIEDKLLMKLSDTKMSDKTKENEVYIKSLDFAGQAVYNVIHPIFLTSKAVFILVYNLKNIPHDPMKPKVEEDGAERELVEPFEMTNIENLELWLSCISSYTDTQRMAKIGELSLPAVFLAGTHADKFDGNLEAARKIIREIYKSLSPSKNPSGCHVKRDKIYTVNNSVSGNGEINDESVRKLKADIEDLSKSLPHMNEDIPINWLSFEEELSNLIEKENKKYITIDDTLKIANKCKVNTSAESKEFLTLLNYLHDLKIVIYFEETKKLFIDTEWLVKVFTKVIEVRPVEKRDGFDESWDKLEEKGVLDRALVEHVWEGLVDGQNTIDSLLLIMEKFSLICRWNTSEGEEVYLVPCMLCNGKKREDIAKCLEHEKSSTMVIRFNTSHLSLGIFPRLFVAIAEEGKKIWPNLRQPKLYKNFCRIFKIGEERKLDICIIQSSFQTICVTVCNIQNIDWQQVTEFCQNFRKLLDQIFDDMQRNFPWMLNMTFEYGILCPVCTSSPNKCKSHKIEGCTRDTCLHIVNEEELSVDTPVCEKEDANLDNVIEEEAYVYWFPRQSKEDIERKGGSEAALVEKFPPLVDVHELQTVSAPTAAEKVAICLQLDKTSLKNPSSEVVKSCRYFCVHYLKPQKRLDIIKELRTTLPSGMTGPLADENKLYERLDYNQRRLLTQSLCGEEVWKRMASEFGISSRRFSFFDRPKSNPAEAILEEVCRTRRLTVGELYDIIVKCDAAAIADEYL